MKQFRILVVEDEERVLNFIRSKLRASGYEVLTAGNGLEALEQARAQEPDLIVLDLLMPEMDGLEMLKELRSFSTVPVIIVSAKGSDIDRIRGLGMGADDYLAKPFNPNELVARIDAIRRRLEPLPVRPVPELLCLEGVTIDFKGSSVVVDGKEEHLTRIEWLLLSELARNSGHTMPYNELLTRVWGAEYRDDIHILRTFISRLRHKLERDPNAPRLIRTVPKVGYIMGQSPA
jgi:DNA-binding response OmpR family regulator